MKFLARASLLMLLVNPTVAQAGQVCVRVTLSDADYQWMMANRQGWFMGNRVAHGLPKNSVRTMKYVRPSENVCFPRGTPTLVLRVKGTGGLYEAVFR